MGTEIEAQVVLCKCAKQHTFGIRVEKREGDWYRTWAFKIDEKRAKQEGFDKAVINGSMDADEGYPGCPYCGSKGFFQCECGKISCLKEESVNGQWDVTCNWCGRRLTVMRAVSALNMKAGGL